MRHGFLIALAAAAATASAAMAATVATPAAFAEVIGQAAPGATIELAAGTYDHLDIGNRHWSPPVTVEAGAAQIRALRLAGVSGLTWHGGTVDGGDKELAGIKIDGSDHVVVDGVAIHHVVLSGIGVGKSSDIRLTNNAVTDSGSDGIDIAMSRRIVIDHNRCSDFHPIPKAHPDCVQMWSNAAEPPTADIVVSNNEAIGDMQGFSGFNHVIGGVDQGGFDRITIEHNHARVTQWHGIALYDCRHCAVRHNRVESLPNRDFPAARAWIKVVGGDDVVNCDNVAVDWPQLPGRGKCRDER